MLLTAVLIRHGYSHSVSAVESVKESCLYVFCLKSYESLIYLFQAKRKGSCIMLHSLQFYCLLCKYTDRRGQICFLRNKPARIEFKPVKERKLFSLPGFSIVHCSLKRKLVLLLKQCWFTRFNIPNPSSNMVRILAYYSREIDRLCGLVNRVPGYRSRGPSSIPGATRFSGK
jgi:hypothetical protein